MTASPAPRGRAHPGTDARRSGDLLAILNRLVPALAPGWSPSPDDFGAALLRIAAQLGEETTQRLDRTSISASRGVGSDGITSRYTRTGWGMFFTSRSPRSSQARSSLLST